MSAIEDGSRGQVIGGADRIKDLQQHRPKQLLRRNRGGPWFGGCPTNPATSSRNRHIARRVACAEQGLLFHRDFMARNGCRRALCISCVDELFSSTAGDPVAGLTTDLCGGRTAKGDGSSPPVDPAISVFGRSKPISIHCGFGSSANGLRPPARAPGPV